MIKTYLKSPRLQPGSTIGLIAPSSPTHPDVLPRIKQGLDSLGYKFKCPLDSSSYYGKNDHLFSSDSAEKRVGAFNSLVADEEVSVVWAIRGGFGAFEILPRLDYRSLRHNPKLIVGFSDVTGILLAAMSQSDVISIHGPSLSRLFPEEQNSETRASLGSVFGFLSGDLAQPFADVSLEVVNEADPVEGVLVGGNLSIIAGLIGTPYFPSFENSILFLEDIGESPQNIYGHLKKLELSGVLENVKGVVLGGFANCVHKKNLGPTTDEVFTKFFSRSDILVVRNAPFGHQELNFSIPLGVTARLNLKSLELTGSPVLS